jgi:hypothetical protein
MDYAEKEALVKCQVFLVEELALGDLYDHLLEEGIFNNVMLENIQVISTKKRLILSYEKIIQKNYVW